MQQGERSGEILKLRLPRFRLFDLMDRDLNLTSRQDERHDGGDELGRRTTASRALDLFWEFAAATLQASSKEERILD